VEVVRAHGAVGPGRGARALPVDRRVLGLDFLVESKVLKGRPFLQTFAYAQVVRDARLNFSFAEFAPSLVVYAQGRQRPWTYGLNWNAAAVQPSDVKQFDFVLVGDRTRALEQTLLLRPGLAEPVTHEGVWRLDRVLGPAPDRARPERP
jgi:hypothetical protein